MHIKNTNGKYLITDDGKIFSVRQNKYMKLRKNNNGYFRTNLFFADGKQRTVMVHRLVAEHFLPNPSGLETVNHKDLNKENNHVSNLEWLSRVDNTKHGAKNHKSWGNAREIVIDDKCYDNSFQASKELGIYSSTIYYRLKSVNFPNYQYRR